MKVRLRERCLPSIPGGPEAIKESRRHGGNRFGLLVSVEEDGTEVPINCEHGGSMWLCPSCAISIVAQNELIPMPEGTPFWITRTSGYEADTPPCEGAYKAEDEDGLAMWRIRIKSLEELVLLAKREGQLVFDEDTIEIYDDYRE